MTMLQAQVNYVARSSMEVGCRVETEHMQNRTPALRDQGVPDVRRGRRARPAARRSPPLDARERRGPPAPRRRRAPARRAAARGGRGKAVVMIVDRSSWGRLRVTGGDRVRFLQGLTTVNVERSPTARTAGARS